ncbi:hypothetical protein DMI70_21095 [Escherichia coli]|nr:hypothetical protein [Escherichia coli]
MLQPKTLQLPPITENHSKARFYAYRFEHSELCAWRFATTLGWLLATLVSIVLIFTLPLTRSCWRSLNCLCALWQ